MTTDADTILPPGPRAGYPGALLFRFRRDPLAFFSALGALGPAAHFRIGPQRFYFLNDPALVQEVLVGRARAFEKGGALQRSKRIMGEGLLTSEGEAHLRHRRMLQPAFHQKRVAAYAEAIVELTERTQWETDRPFDVYQALLRLTLQIVGTTLFGHDVDAQAAEIEDAIAALLALFPTLTMPGGEWLQHVPTPAHRRATAALARLDRIVNAMIQARREHPAERHDLLSMILQAEDPEGGGGLSARQVRDEVFTVFLAGHETTATAIAWTLHLLATHPEVQARVAEELERTLADRPPTLADLAQLPYTRQVFSESLRLYPPGWAIGRRALEDVRIGPYAIPSRALVFMSPYVMHRQSRFFADPGRFDPDRWAGSEAPERPRFAYFPFGGGARGCIGEPFAWMAGTLVLASLLRRWRFSPSGARAVVPEPLITLRPRGGLWLSAATR